MSDDLEVTATVTVTASRSAARQPRAIVQINGTAIPQAIPTAAATTLSGWISWEVSSNGFYEADTFRVSFAASALPQTNDSAWFATQREAYVSIYAGFPQNPDSPNIAELTQLIYGRIDEVHYDPAQRIIECTGRDLTAAFIDAKIASGYPNQTSSKVAEQLAAVHGLGSIVKPTSIKVGNYYDNDQVQLQASRSEWDLLAYLARREGFVVYVAGQLLHFEPDPTNTADPYPINWKPPSSETDSPTCNVIELSFSRSLTVGKGIAVTARSPNFDTGRPVVQSYPSNAKGTQAGKAGPFGDVQNFYFTMAAGASPVQVQAFAKAQYDAIIAHEMKMAARMPADDILTMQMPIRVQGTGTAFDQIYFPRKIERQMNIDDGYVMTVEAQNVNTDSTPPE